MKLKFLYGEKNKSKSIFDGANIFYTQKKLGWNIDWRKAKDYLERGKEIIEWRYYVGLKEGDKKMRKYLSYLDRIGFVVITKPLKKIKIQDSEPAFKIYKTKFIYKANFDVEIATDILLDKSPIEEIVLFSGDSDFRYLVEKLKSIGKKLIVFASKKTLSWELKLETDEVIYFEGIEDKIKRE